MAMLRDKFLKAMEAENLPTSIISASVVLPIMPLHRDEASPALAVTAF
jgi:hypothetical protein